MQISQKKKQKKNNKKKQKNKSNSAIGTNIFQHNLPYRTTGEI